MKFRQFGSLLLLVSLVTFGCSKSDQSGDGSIKLEVKSKVGDKQMIETDIVQHITTKVMEQDLTIDQTIEMDMALTTKEVKDTGGSIILMGVFDRWAMKMDMQGASMTNSAEFDTKDSTKNKGEMAPMMQQLFSRMIGLPFEMEMTKNGKVVRTNMKEVMSQVMPPGSTNAMSDDAMATVPFPDHPVKPGDTWPGDIERDMSGKKVMYKSTYTLKEVKDGVAHISFNGDLLQKEDNKKLGTMGGTYSLATATGMLREAEIKMQIDMEVDNPAGTKQQVKMDQTIKMTGKS
jgi:hypothetical protein